MTKQGTAKSANNFIKFDQISVYLKTNADANVVAERIKEFDHVEGVRIIPKEKSWNDLKRELDIADI